MGTDERLLREWAEYGVMAPERREALMRVLTQLAEAQAEVERLKEEARLNRAAAEKHYALAEERLALLDEAEAAVERAYQ